MYIDFQNVCECVCVCNESLQAPAVCWTKRQQWNKPVVLQLCSDLEDIKDAKTESLAPTTMQLFQHQITKSRAFIFYCVNNG